MLDIGSLQKILVFWSLFCCPLRTKYCSIQSPSAYNTKPSLPHLKPNARQAPIMVQCQADLKQSGIDQISLCSYKRNKLIAGSYTDMMKQKPSWNLYFTNQFINLNLILLKVLIKLFPFDVAELCQHCSQENYIVSYLEKKSILKFVKSDNI